jgi:hypothetical protein
MRELQTEIIIAATPEKIWNVLVDLEGWKSWSPTTTDASGTVALGGQLDIGMKGKDNKPSHRYSPKVIEYDPPKKMRWHAKMGASFILANDKRIELISTPQGTKLIHSELFSGLMPRLMWRTLQQQVPWFLGRFNEALKARVESL